MKNEGGAGGFNVPTGKYVQVWSPTLKPEIIESSGRPLYKWSSNQLKPTDANNKKDDFADAKPAHNTPGTGRRLPATEALRAQVDEITRDGKIPEGLIQALYPLVSARIP
jgi:hypothetical protein